MKQLLLKAAYVLPLLGAALSPAEASAAQVRGSVQLPARALEAQVVGYTRTRLVAPSRAVARPAAALFLKVKDSLPLPAVTQHPTVRLYGLTLSPEVVSCAVDGKVVFQNDEPMPMTVRVGQDEVGTIAPGEARTYECTAGSKAEDQRPVRVVGWRHMRGVVHVGEVGVAALAGPEGDFALSAPVGRYELQIITIDGVTQRAEVEVKGGDVDLGRVVVGAAEAPAGAPPAGEASGEGGQ
jgi:hypothetical protein